MRQVYVIEGRYSSEAALVAFDEATAEAVASAMGVSYAPVPALGDPADIGEPKPEGGGEDEG